MEENTLEELDNKIEPLKREKLNYKRREMIRNYADIKKKVIKRKFTDEIWQGKCYSFDLGKLNLITEEQKLRDDSLNRSQDINSSVHQNS